MRYALLLSSLALGCNSGETPRPNSTFDMSDEGWSVLADARGAETRPTWAAAGGNPGGRISNTSDGSNGTWFFRAPAAWRGDNGAFYGARLLFDLKLDAAVSQPLEDADVKLVGAGMVLVLDEAKAPTRAWTSYQVSLSADAGWKKDNLSGATASDEEVKRVLVSTDDVWIRGDFNAGASTASLDNARWGAQ